MSSRIRSIPRSQALVLPALSLVLRRAGELCVTRETLEGEFAQLVEVDAALCGAVQRVALCPLYAPTGPGALVDTLQRLSRTVIGRILESVPVVGSQRSREEVEEACGAWVHALAVAAAARWLSNMGGHDDADEAYRAGLLHDVMRRLVRLGFDDPDPADVADVLERQWFVGEHVADVLRHLYQGGVDAGDPTELESGAQRLLAVVRRADTVVHQLGFGGEACGERAHSPDPLAEAVEEAVVLELAHAGGLLGLPPCPAREFLRELTNAELRTADTDPPVLQTSTPDTVVRVANVHQTIIATRGMETVNDILTSGLRALHRGLDFERVIMLERIPGVAEELRGRLVFDSTRLDLVHGPGGIVVPSTPGGAIRRALDTGFPSRSDDPDADGTAMRMLASPGFAVARVRAATANIGAVVADHFFTRRPITETEVTALGLLCSSLGLVIENMALDTQGQKLRALAEKDELTGINNRRNVLALLQKEIDRARRYGKALSVVMIDVDHFKSWNDLHGHQVGDYVLQTIAQLLTSVSREIDSYGRYGGEEFIVVLPETPVERAMLYAERLRLTVEEHSRGLLSGQFPNTPLTVSLGVTHLAPTGDDIEAMIHRADAALYAAKNQGRNRVCVLPPGRQLAVPEPPAPSRGILGEL